MAVAALAALLRPLDEHGRRTGGGGGGGGGDVRIDQDDVGEW